MHFIEKAYDYYANFLGYTGADLWERVAEEITPRIMQDSDLEYSEADLEAEYQAGKADGYEQGYLDGEAGL